jgi:hypothetical protein
MAGRTQSGVHAGERSFQLGRPSIPSLIERTRVRLKMTLTPPRQVIKRPWLSSMHS